MHIIQTACAARRPWTRLAGQTGGYLPGWRRHVPLCLHEIPLSEIGELLPVADVGFKTCKLIRGVWTSSQAEASRGVHVILTEGERARRRDGVASETRAAGTGVPGVQKHAKNCFCDGMNNEE